MEVLLSRSSGRGYRQQKYFCIMPLSEHSCDAYCNDIPGLVCVGIGIMSLPYIIQVEGVSYQVESHLTDPEARFISG